MLILCVLLNFAALLYGQPPDDSMYIRRQEARKLPDSTTNTGHIRHLIARAGSLALSAPERALDDYTEALSLIKKLQYKKEEAEVYNFMGRVYEQLGIYDLAMEYYFKSLRIYEKIGDDNAVTWAFSDIGNIYYVQENYPAALKNYRKALEIFRTENDDYGIATTLNNIALVHENLNQPDTALALFNQALRIRRKIGDANLVAHSYTYIGRIYGYCNQSAQALEYYQKAYDLYSTTGNLNGMASMLRYIAGVYRKAGKYRQSIGYLNRALEVYQQSGNNFGIAETHGGLSQAELESGHDNEALQHARTMLRLTEKLGVLPAQSQAYQLLSDIYEKMNRPAVAFEHYKKMVAVNDSIQSKEVAEAISRQEFVYEREKRNRELLLRENEIALLEQNERIDRIKKNALTAGILLFLIIGTLIYSRQYNIHKNDRRLIEKNEEIRKTQQVLVDLQQKEKEALKNELEARQTALTNFALHIIQRNELLRDIRQKLQQLRKSNGTQSQEKLNALIVSVTQSKSLNHDIQKFQEKVEEQNDAFFTRVMKKYPELTQNDRRLIALLRLNLTTKEMASLNNISEKAVEMGRYRLRKKLGLDAHTNLITFLKNL